MIRKTLAAALSCIIVASSALAEEPSPDRPVIMTITDSTPGPVDWTALSPEAVAEIMAEKRMIPQRINLEVTRATEQERARCEERVDNLQARSKADLTVVKVRLEATTKERDLILSEAKKLERRAKLSKILIAVGTAAIVAGAGVVVGFSIER